MSKPVTIEFQSNFNDWHDLYGGESFGSSGSFGIRIVVAGSLPRDLTSSEIWGATHDAVKKIEFAVRAAFMAENPEALARRVAERTQIAACFGPEALFVEEIPNGYCSDWCCTQLPWFIVTTRVGRIKIGWRKRVINIEWDQTIGTKTAEELFPDEDVTKGGRHIHAWSGEHAARYISAIIASGGGGLALPSAPETKRLT